MKDIEIAHRATLLPMEEIAEKAGIPPEAVIPYGKNMAKVDTGLVRNEKDGKIILVKDIARHTCPLPNRFRQLRAVLSLYLTKEGRAVSKIFENVTGIDRELLRESGKNYPAELALFVVSPSCRGQGVGKALFQAALDYTGQQKLDEIYLFTDTSCNYGFYEHQGMRRRCEREHLFHINGKAASMRFFIYDCKRTKSLHGKGAST